MHLITANMKSTCSASAQTLPSTDKISAHSASAFQSTESPKLSETKLLKLYRIVKLQLKHELQ